MPLKASLVLAALLAASPIDGFVVSDRVAFGVCRKRFDRAVPTTPTFGNVNAWSRCEKETRLAMYNLPPSPSGGGGGGGIKDILAGAATLVAIVAFFVSPLGGIFFAILNSVFLLSLLAPVVLWIGFQIWQSFYTIEGPCPNCGIPLRVVKEEDNPSICLNCGTVVVSTEDNSGIDFYNNQVGNQVIVDEGFQPSFFDSWFGGGAAPSPMDIETPQQRQAQFQREQTVIDVEVTERK